MRKLLPYVIWIVGAIIFFLVIFHFVVGVPWENLLKPKITWAVPK